VSVVDGGSWAWRGGQANSERFLRFLDVLLASAALLAAIPLLVVIGILVKLDSPGPMLFVQERLGRFRVPFPCIKFRTMQVDAERRTGPVWACDRDPRITRIGRLLRRSRLDELPQLVNVLRGEMSMVGPRPIRRHFADQLAVLIPGYDRRFDVRPGITGWAQVNRGYAASFDEQAVKFDLDMYYLRHVSVWLYLQIVARTVRAVVRLEGA
jgi:lipopolysaccharide/colanic/teichoic acid biosynthesis glycosyltransferase